VLNGVNAFLKWKEEHHVKPLKSEKFIYSQKHDYVGITDIIAEIDGSLCIVDIKTSNGIYEEMNLQVAAYCTPSKRSPERSTTGDGLSDWGRNLMGRATPSLRLSM
jgi:hypothetical protein